MVTERTREYETSGLSAVEMRTGIKNSAVFGLDQHIPDYYDVIYFNIPRVGKKEFDKYLFLRQREEPDKQAAFDELMEEVYNQTGTLLTGPYAISTVRVMLPSKNSTSYRFKIVASSDHYNYQSRVAIVQLLIDHGLTQC